MNVKSLLIVCFFLFFGGKTMTAQDAEYIGATKCKMCHNKATTGAQYKIWAASKHAKAMEALKGVDKTNPKCLKCHSTYDGVSDKSLIATLKQSEGVSCESCHGAGSLYKSNSTMKNRKKAISKGLIIPTEKVCLRCHNSESPNFKGFNFKEYMKKIAHPVPPKS